MSTKELTNKQQIFVEHYLQTWNASEAARRAEYSNPGAQGHRLLKTPAIAQAIKDRIGEQAMPAGEVLERLADQARSTMEDFVSIVDYPEMEFKKDDETGKYVHVPTGKMLQRAVIDIPKAAGLGKLHLIKKLSETKYGLSVELYDAQAALALLGKHHGLLVDQSDVKVKGDPNAPLTIKVVYDDLTPTTEDETETDAESESD